MKKMFVVAAVVVLLSCLVAAAHSSAVFVPVDFASACNTDLRSWMDVPISVGECSYGGVDFSIPAGSTWLADLAPGGSQKVLEISGLSISGAKTLYTLINTYWGQGGPSYAYVEVLGRNGSYYRKDLFGNVDIRDHHDCFWTNSINGTTTVQVAGGMSYRGEGYKRLDMQIMSLPASFLTDAVSMIRVVDNGGHEFQRVYVSGITAEVVPEPSSFLALIGGLGCVLPMVRRKRRTTKNELP